MKIYLASKSPRRQQLLQQVGIEFNVIDVNVDEHWDGKETARVYVERVALEKAQAGKSKINGNGLIMVIGADTSVVLDDMVLGKAENIEQATTMLKQLSGRIHYVYSSVALVTDKDQRVKTSISRVCFRNLTDEEIKSYCNTGEPIGKAGGYAIQGQGAVFVQKLEGSYSGVMGLPLFEMSELLKEVG